MLLCLDLTLAMVNQEKKVDLSVVIKMLGLIARSAINKPIYLFMNAFNYPFYSVKIIWEYSMYQVFLFLRYGLTSATSSFIAGVLD